MTQPLRALLNPLYTGRLFHCYKLDESSSRFGGVRSILLLLFYFCRKILFANNVDPDQMPHNVASDQGLHCLPMTLLRVSRLKWVKANGSSFSGNRAAIIVLSHFLIWAYS